MSDPDSTTNPYFPPQTEDVLREAMEYRDQFEDEREFEEALAVWPVCPQCGRRRSTTCPICNVSGNLFPLADADFWFKEAEPPESQACSERGSSCQCGHDHSCGSDPSSPSLPSSDFLRKYVPGATKTDDSVRGQTPAEPLSDTPTDQSTIPSQLHNELQPGLPAPGKPSIFLVEEGSRGPLAISVTADQFALGMLGELEDQDSSEGNAPKSLRLVLCHVCSEPFEPRFRNQCEWCGHVFDEPAGDTSEAGELDRTEEYKPVLAHEEEFNPSIVMVFVVLGLLFLGAMAYLWFLFSG